ncbi:Alpha/beta hydrolase fold-1 [Exophiala viscosa]|uniref:Alpha/beta hydrolase fold-1 n=1 Tax=Exophiala viscosa TaxID=2486360 RepID=UPI00219B60E1|nr:Alpha/beta hydrolase fold-1 [Exophiala viscosa]
MTMSKPSILFIPGSYVLLPAYQHLLDAVSRAGYEIQGIHLPTIGLNSRQGRDGPAPSTYDDAAVIAQEAEKLADQGKDVVLMGHSYAGIPMSQSTKGLGKDERKAQGKLGGIVHLAYISCLVPAVGQSAGSLLSRCPDNKRPHVSIDENGWMLMEDPAATAGMICQKLPPEEGEALVRDFAKHSAQSFGNELTHAGYKDIPVSYLFCEEDMAGPPDFQRDMIAMIEEVSGRKVDVTSIKADHCPHLSAEKETIEWALSVAKKAEEI